MRAESSAYNSTHLVLQKIFCRAVSGWVRFKPCFSFSSDSSAAGSPETCSCYNTALGPQPSWPDQGVCPEGGRTLHGGHSCNWAVSNNLAMRGSDWRLHKWILSSKLNVSLTSFPLLDPPDAMAIPLPPGLKESVT